MDLKMEHVGIFSQNVEKSIQFYEKLGFSRHFMLPGEDLKPWITYIKCDEDYFFIELLHTNEDKCHPEGKVRHICLSVQDINHAAEELQSQGITLYYGLPLLGKEAPDPFVPIKEGGETFSFYVQDPDGNAVRIIQYI